MGLLFGYEGKGCNERSVTIREKVLEVASNQQTGILLVATRRSAKLFSVVWSPEVRSMPSTDPNQSPAPEPEDFDFSALEGASSSLAPDASEVLQPLFLEHCRRLGSERAPTVDEVSTAEVLRAQLYRLFGDPHEAQRTFLARILEARGIDCWQGGKALSVLEGFLPSSGAGFAIPLDLAHSDQSAYRSHRFWKSPDYEQVSGPAALLVTKREAVGVVEVDTIYSDAAMEEVFKHALYVARSVQRLGKGLVQSFGLGSIIVETLLDTVQLSHEAGDIGVPVEGEPPSVMDSGAFWGILGVSTLELSHRTQIHRVGIVAPDPRRAVTELESGLVVASDANSTLLQKLYQIYLPVADGLIEKPLIQGVTYSTFRAA